MTKRKSKRPRDTWVQRLAAAPQRRTLAPAVFKQSAKEIARSLQMGGAAFSAAMSSLNLYLNRSGKNLSPSDRRRLERAKVELRRVFGRE